jgi:hydroxymethylglutaryl-CoA reductase (NADPH)
MATLGQSLWAQARQAVGASDHKDQRYKKSEANGRLYTPIVSVLVLLTSSVCAHPLRVFFLVVAIASTSYVGLLEGSIFDSTGSFGRTIAQSEWSTLLASSTRLNANAKTDWNWQTTIRPVGKAAGIGEEPVQSTLFTLKFPASPHTPTTEILSQLTNYTGKVLPVTHHDGLRKSPPVSIAFSVPSGRSFEFFSRIHEFTAGSSIDPVNSSKRLAADQTEGASEASKLKWVAKSNSRRSSLLSRTTWTTWAQEAWADLWALIQVWTHILIKRRNGN